MTAFLHIHRFLLALVAAAALTACGLHRDSLKPYSPDMVQGNFVSREQRQLLRPGMSRVQVRDLLGTPLVVSVFRADRWDYAFTIRRQGVAPQQFRLTVYFDKDVLDRVEGDDLPSETEFVGRLTRPLSTGKPPVLEATEAQLGRFPVTHSPASSAPAAPAPALNYPPLEPAAR